MSTPYKPLLAVVKLGATEIGSGMTTAASTSYKQDVDEHYGFGDLGKPTLVKGNKHSSGKFTKVFIDNTYLALVLAGTQVDVVIYPNGKATGQPTITVKNSILNVHDFKAGVNTVEAEDVTFIGDEVITGTAA
jgi:hypothetical protein